MIVGLFVFGACALNLNSLALFLGLVFQIVLCVVFIFWILFFGARLLGLIFGIICVLGLVSCLNLLFGYRFVILIFIILCFWIMFLDHEVWTPSIVFYLSVLFLIFLWGSIFGCRLFFGFYFCWYLFGDFKLCISTFVVCLEYGLFWIVVCLDHFSWILNFWISRSLGLICGFCLLSDIVACLCLELALWI